MFQKKEKNVDNSELNSSVGENETIGSEINDEDEFGTPKGSTESLKSVHTAAILDPSVCYLISDDKKLKGKLAIKELVKLIVPEFECNEIPLIASPVASTSKSSPFGMEIVCRKEISSGNTTCSSEDRFSIEFSEYISLTESIDIESTNVLKFWMANENVY
uniref:Uncharacterized protein n=1 Tax=Meloidogyne javanica TaxID=6303 RepID=A0A915NF39_MELJA